MYFPSSAYSPLQKDLTSNSGFDELLHHSRNTTDLCRNLIALDRTNWKRGGKKNWPSVMINKYITGYNSGEWRLTLTEHYDLHAIAKLQSFNNNNNNKPSVFACLLLNVNFLTCKHGIEKNVWLPSSAKLCTLDLTQSFVSFVWSKSLSPFLFFLKVFWSCQK